MASSEVVCADLKLKYVATNRISMTHYCAFLLVNISVYIISLLPVISQLVDTISLMLLFDHNCVCDNWLTFVMRCTLILILMCLIPDVCVRGEKQCLG